MLQFYHSNNLEVLVSELAQIIQQQPLINPLNKEYIIVQSKGMEHWLSMNLAHKLGVCANIDYPFPDNMLWRIMAWLMEDLGQYSYYRREVMLWALMKILTQQKNSPAFKALTAYWQNDISGNKQYQLAWRLANLYDQYVIFRPDWIQDWEQDLQPRALEKNDQAIWQAMLWNSLIKYYGHNQHKAKLKLDFIDKLKQLTPTELAIKLPQRISIFGISALPPFYVDIFSQLSNYIEINFFLFNPCEEFWTDIVSKREIAHRSQQDGKPVAAENLYFTSGNSLLASMGQLGRDFINILQQNQSVNSLEYSKFIPIVEQNLLTTIQADILQLRERGTANLSAQLIDIQDKSVQIHLCHSRMREIEILYDQLLHLFEQHADNLLPKDIVVMMPEVELYVPMIEAVFGSSVDKKTKIPFSIADRNLRYENVFIDAFFAILELVQSRFEVNKVLSILEYSPIREKYQLSPVELNLIQKWVTETNIRWGIDVRHLSDLQLVDNHQNTWQIGLQRMLLGYALPANQERLYYDLLPYDAIEGNQSLILGQFVDFMQQLFALVEDLRIDKDLWAWKQLLLEVLDKFICDEEQGLTAWQQIKTVLDNLVNAENNGEAQLAGFDDKVNFNVVFAYLKQYLTAEIMPLHFLTGGITFCSLLPMRSIPFKVICLLGMNDHDYPRAQQPLSFDLIHQYPRLGDRSRRDNDRYLFLEAMLSAQQYLYISYIGYNINDNSELPPSVLVSELIDYVQRAFAHPTTDIIDAITTKHPLQAFSKRYFNKQTDKLWSYSQEYCAASNAGLQARLSTTAFVQHKLAAEPIKELNILQLQAFFHNPCKYLLQKVLAINLPQPQGFMPETEPFILDNLTEYKLRNLLINYSLKKEHPIDLKDIIRASGELPYSNIGDFAYANLQLEINNFIEIVRRWTNGNISPPTAVIINDLSVPMTVQIPELYNGRYVQYRGAKIKAKDLINFWLLHLSLNCLQPTESILIALDNQYIAKPISDSNILLAELIQLYQRGQHELLNFFPETSLKFSQTSNLDKAETVWYGNDQARGEIENQYYQLCFAHLDNASLAEYTDFKELAQQFFGKMFKYVDFFDR